ELRMRLASERNLPPYIVFSDATLRDLARVRPSTLDLMRLAYGVGEAKLRDFGDAVMQVLDEHCQARQLPRDNTGRQVLPELEPARPKKASAGSLHAATLFREGASIDEVVNRLGRSKSTVCEYLCDFIRSERPSSIARWVPDDVYSRVSDTIARVGGE